MPEYFVLPTLIGQQKIAAALAGTPLLLTEMSVGDGNGTTPTPLAAQIALVHEVWRGSLESITPMIGQPNARLVEAIVPANAGQLNAREFGIWDNEGDLIFVGNMPTAELPAPASGSTRVLWLQAAIPVSDLAEINLVVDNSLYATRVYVDSAISTHEGKADPHTQYLMKSARGAANGVAGLDAGGKVPLAQLPAVAITDTYVVNSQAAMLALSAQTGDVAVRTDLNKSLILRGANPATLGDWQELLTPPNAVLSVAGRTGAVTLDQSDVGLDQVDNTADADKPVSTAQQTALNLKADNATTITAGGLATGGGDLSSNRIISVPKASGAVATGGTDDTAAMTSLATKQQMDARRGAANGLASLDATGKVPSNQLPATAITDTFVVNSQAAMLALAAQTGDVAVRTDLSKSFILQGANPATLGDWQELLAPLAAVTSVAGKTGAVSLEVDDVTGLQAALDAQEKGRLIDVQIYDTDGAHIWNKPAEMSASGFVIIEAVGGGGGGAGAEPASGANAVSIAGAGAAGTWAVIKVGAADITATADIEIGAGGITGNASDGQAGGDTSVAFGGKSLTFPGGPGGNVFTGTTYPSAIGLTGGKTAASSSGAFTSLVQLKGLPLGSGVYESSTLQTTTFYLGPINGSKWCMLGNGEPSAMAEPGDSAGSTPYGVIGGGTDGTSARSAGSGGGGSFNADHSAPRTGGHGKAGKVIIYTYA